MVAEVAPNGTHSMLARASHTVEESLVDLSVVILLAWSGGVVLKTMPGIGDFISKKVGDNAGAVPLVTYGGKAGVLIHEFCEVPELQPENEKDAGQLKEKWDKLDELAAKLHDGITKSEKHKALTEEEKNEIDVQLQKITEKSTILKAINQIRFLKKLTTHSHLLPHLPSRTKRELLQAAEVLFADKPEIIMAVQNKLNPVKPYSVASRTLRVIIGYPLGLLRIICSLFTGNFKQPVKEFGEKIVKDVIRLVRCLHGMGAFVVLALYAVIGTALRAIADLLVNDLAARAQGWLQGNQHTISQNASQVAARISSTYYRLGELLTPTRLYKSVTHPHPSVVLGKPLLQCYESLLKKVKVEGNNENISTHFLKL